MRIDAVGVGHVQIAVAIDGQSHRPVEVARQAPSRTLAGRRTSDHGRRRCRPCRCGGGVGARVGDVASRRRRHGDAGRRREAARRRRRRRPSRSGRRRPATRRDDAVRRYRRIVALPASSRRGAGRVDRDAAQRSERRARHRSVRRADPSGRPGDVVTTPAGVMLAARSGCRRRRTRCPLASTVTALGEVERRGRPGAVGRAGDTGRAGERRDHAVRRDLADRVVGSSATYSIAGGDRAPCRRRREACRGAGAVDGADGAGDARERRHVAGRPRCGGSSR